MGPWETKQPSQTSKLRPPPTQSLYTQGTGLRAESGRDQASRCPVPAEPDTQHRQSSHAVQEDTVGPEHATSLSRCYRNLSVLETPKVRTMIDCRYQLVTNSRERPLPRRPRRRTGVSKASRPLQGPKDLPFTSLRKVLTFVKFTCPENSQAWFYNFRCDSEVTQHEPRASNLEFQWQPLRKRGGRETDAARRAPVPSAHVSSARARLGRTCRPEERHTGSLRDRKSWSCIDV